VLSYMQVPQLRSSYPATLPDAEAQALRKRVQAYLQRKITAGERYSETKLAREAGVAQQTLNDFMRCKTNCVTRLTRIKLTEFLESHGDSAAGANTGPAAPPPPPEALLAAGLAASSPAGSPAKGAGPKQGVHPLQSEQFFAPAQMATHHYGQPLDQSSPAQ
jgi:hypothetical protein